MLKNQNRKLAAILFTDIVGYTAMMQANEQSAIKTVNRHQQVLEERIPKHGGELLQYYGDGSLSIFPSASGAVKAAILIQEQLREPPQVPLRIGIHIGEVSFDKGKVFGDGVNIASRIESLGQTGTILFSRHVYDKIRNKPEFKATSLGSYSFKNVGELIEVFALSNEGFPVPKRSSISGKLNNTPKKQMTFDWKVVAGILISFIILFLLGLKFGQFYDRDQVNPFVKRYQISLPVEEPLDTKGSFPTGVSSAKALDVSPNGDKLVYVGKENGDNYLFLREIDNWETKKLFGTKGAYGPFFSPDGEWIGFFANKKMKKISVPNNNRQPIILCDVSLPYGAIWSADENIYFSNNESTTLSKVSEDGGVAEVIIHQDDQSVMSGFLGVNSLPNDQMLLISDADDFLAVVNIDTKEIKTLSFRGGNPNYLSSGHLVYTRLGQLFVVRFDPDKLTLLSPPVLIASQIVTSNEGLSQVTFSQNGNFYFVPGSYEKTAKLVQIDRKNISRALPFPVDIFGTFQLSPNGRYLAIEVTKTHADEIWVYNLQQHTTSKLTNKGNNFGMAWSPNSDEITYMSKRKGEYGLYRKPIGGIGEEELITIGKYRPYSYQQRGEWLSTGSNLFLNPSDSIAINSAIHSPTTIAHPMFSPNDKYFTYHSDESGQFEVYVQDFPPTGKRFQVSIGGGEEGLWSRNGDELFYRNGNDWMVLSVSIEGVFKFEKPEILFTGPYVNVGGHSYEVMPDAQSFLVLEAVDTTSLFTEIRVVENWMNELDQQ